MYNTISVERLQTPAVALVNKGFALDAQSAASGKGMPGLRVVPETIPSECTVHEEIEAGVDAVVRDMIAGLTRPLTAEEKSPQPKEADTMPRIIFKGELKEVNHFFYRRGWGDGLPIIPPTEEAVREMLSGTDLPAGHVVGKIVPRLGKATVEKVAINAVMAGCLPTHMPVLIAAIQALLEPRAYFGVYEVSTGSWAPMYILNGPIRHSLRINSGAGALSPGDMANAAIGRAIGLIIKNIGGARKGIEDMGVLGNPGKYSMVVAENEEESPWEPLHVEQGLDRGDSALTLFFPNSFSQIWPYGSDDKGILRGITSNVIPGRRGLFCLMIIPALANVLARKNWTKEAIRGFVAEYARVPAYRNPDYWGSGLPGARSQRSALDPEESMSILNADWIRIFVAGGPGNFIGLLAGGAIAKDLDFVTKKIDLPKEWDRLVEKYKNITPTYARY